jgi:hypothetical protein
VWWLVVPVVVVTLEPVLSDLIAYLRECRATRQRARLEVVDEWIVSLDGDDIGVLTDSVVTDMFWKQLRVVGDDARLFDESLWLQCRFRFRHAQHGHYAAHAFCGGLRPTRANPFVSMRGLY